MSLMPWGTGRGSRKGQWSRLTRLGGGRHLGHGPGVHLDGTRLTARGLVLLGPWRPNYSVKTTETEDPNAEHRNDD